MKNSSSDKIITKEKSIKFKKFRFFVVPHNEFIRKIINNIGKNKILYFIKYSVIVANVVILALDSTTLSNKEIKILNILDFACLTFFVVELILYFLLNPKEFIKNKLNIIDLILFIVNIIGLAHLLWLEKLYDLADSKKNFYSIIRSFQVIRIIKILMKKEFFPGIATLLFEIFGIILKLKDFLIITLIFFIWITLMGRDLYSTQTPNYYENFTQYTEFSRCNYQTFGNSFFSNLIMFFNEDWNLNASIHYRLYSPINSIYLTFNILTLAIFLNKFFLALLINGIIQSKKMKNLITNKSFPLARFKNLHFFIWIKNLNLTKLCSKFNFLQLKFSKATFFIKYLDSLFEKNFFFQKLMFIFCCFSLLLVGLHDDFSPDDNGYNILLKMLDLPMFAIFILELIVLILNKQNSLFSQKIVIRLIVCVSYLVYFITNINILKLLMLFRFVLMIHRNKGLKRAVHALLLSLSEIFYLFAIFFLFILLFGCIGVKLFKGELWKCSIFDKNLLKLPL